jgi:uncharacterized protein (DUF1684 family)
MTGTHHGKQHGRDPIRFVMTCLAAALLAGGLIGCGGSATTDEQDTVYIEDIKTWHAERIERLREPTSWLSLVGLFWLEEGPNPFGAGPSNSVVFPKGKAPAAIGSFVLASGDLTVEIEPGAGVTHEGAQVTSMKMYHDQDPDHEVTVLELGSLSWYAIKRGDRIGVRLKDSESEQLRNFQGVDTYPIDAKWRIEATLEPHDPPGTISIVNVLGDESEEPSPGTLTFTAGGKTHTLHPIGEPGDEQLFLVFADKTSGKDTYGGGRFLVVDAPGEDGRVEIDFNKAYNPPCVFSPYATCPLPPEQNLLTIAVTAGEKNYGNAKH